MLLFLFLFKTRIYLCRLSKWMTSDPFMTKSYETNKLRNYITTVAPSLNTSLPNWCEVLRSTINPKPNWCKEVVAPTAGECTMRFSFMLGVD